MKNRVYKKRLLKLADFLQKLPPKRFDYGDWVGEDWEGKPDLSCGTTACALGWATAMPKFRKLGLYLNPDGFPQMVGDNTGGTYEASATIFGLSTSEYSYLFLLGTMSPFDKTKYGPDEDAFPKEVAKHIRKFVAKKYKSKK